MQHWPHANGYVRERDVSPFTPPGLSLSLGRIIVLNLDWAQILILPLIPLKSLSSPGLPHSAQV